MILIELILSALSHFALTIISKKISHKSINGNLKYGWFIHGLACFFLVFTIILGYVFIFKKYNFNKPGETFAIIALLLFASISTIYSFVEAFKTYGKFDKISIQFHTLWTGTKNEKWKDLVSVEFSTYLQWYNLRFKSGAIIRISNFLNGNGLVINHVKSLGYKIKEIK